MKIAKRQSMSVALDIDESHGSVEVQLYYATGRPNFMMLQGRLERSTSLVFSISPLPQGSFNSAVPEAGLPPYVDPKIGIDSNLLTAVKEVFFQKAIGSSCLENTEFILISSAYSDTASSAYNATVTMEVLLETLCNLFNGKDTSAEDAIEIAFRLLRSNR